MLFKIHDAFGVELITHERENLDLGNHTICKIGDSIVDAVEKYHMIVMNCSNRDPAAQVEISHWFGDVWKCNKEQAEKD